MVTGGMLGGFFATNIGHFHPFGIEGWRFAFYFVAAISMAVCVLVLRFATDPRKKVTISLSSKDLPGPQTAWPSNFFQLPQAQLAESF